MKFNNKWDVLPDREVNNRQREGRVGLYKQEGDSSRAGVFGEVAYVERERGSGQEEGREAADDELEMRLL